MIVVASFVVSVASSVVFVASSSSSLLVFFCDDLLSNDFAYVVFDETKPWIDSLMSTSFYRRNIVPSVDAVVVAYRLVESKWGE
jgi:hypothetical protein